jgi:hypothetical protein
LGKKGILGQPPRVKIGIAISDDVPAVPIIRGYFENDLTSDDAHPPFSLSYHLGLTLPVGIILKRDMNPMIRDQI